MNSGPGHVQLESMCHQPSLLFILFFTNGAYSLTGSKDYFSIFFDIFRNFLIFQIFEENNWFISRNGPILYPRLNKLIKRVC